VLSSSRLSGFRRAVKRIVDDIEEHAPTTPASADILAAVEGGDRTVGGGEAITG